MSLPWMTFISFFKYYSVTALWCFATAEALKSIKNEKQTQWLSETNSQGALSLLFTPAGSIAAFHFSTLLYILGQSILTVIIYTVGYFFSPWMLFSIFCSLSALKICKKITRNPCHPMYTLIVSSVKMWIFQKNCGRYYRCWYFFLSFSETMLSASIISESCEALS